VACVIYLLLYWQVQFIFLTSTTRGISFYRQGLPPKITRGLSRKMSAEKNIPFAEYVNGLVTVSPQQNLLIGKYCLKLSKHQNLILGKFLLF
jgi:hypothetical protein